MFRAGFVLLTKRKPPPAPQRNKIVRHLGRQSSNPRSRHTENPEDAESLPAEAKGGEPCLNSTALTRITNEEVLSRGLQSGQDASVSKSPPCRLATAVSTIIVPPVANMYLEGMKQTLTPVVRRPPEDGSPGLGQVQYMEEYYTSRKGPLFATAVIAGTNAVKHASTLIPFCHPITIQKCSFTFRRRVVGSGLDRSALPHRVVIRKRVALPPSPQPNKPECSVLYCFCTVATEQVNTGMETEALTGATVAGLTLYDMLKSLPGAQEDGLAIGEAFVLAKRGSPNDFTKLLMSEPDRSPAQTPMSLTPTNTAAASPPDSSLPVRPTKPQEDASEKENNGAPNQTKDKENSHEEQGIDEAEQEQEEDQEQGQGSDFDESSVIPPARKAPSGSARSLSAAAIAADTGAWWRSSKQEKKLQELYPRRKYGEGARVSPPERPLPKNEPSAQIKLDKSRHSKQTNTKPVGRRGVRGENYLVGRETNAYEREPPIEETELSSRISSVHTAERKNPTAGQLARKPVRAVVVHPPALTPAKSSITALKSNRAAAMALGRTAVKTTLQGNKKAPRAIFVPSRDEHSDEKGDEDEDEDDPHDECELEEQELDHEQEGNQEEEEDEEEEEQDEQEEEDEDYAQRFATEEEGVEEQEEGADLDDEEEVAMSTFRKDMIQQKGKKRHTTISEEDRGRGTFVKGRSDTRSPVRAIHHDCWDHDVTIYEDDEPVARTKKLKKRRQ